MPARFVTTSLVTKRAGIAARFVTLVTKRAVVTKRAATRGTTTNPVEQKKKISAGLKLWPLTVKI